MAGFSPWNPVVWFGFRGQFCKWGWIFIVSLRSGKGPMACFFNFFICAAWKIERSHNVK